MIHLFPLLAAALLSLQYSCVTAENLDNRITPNQPATPKRRLRKNVSIRVPLPDVVELAPGARVELECVVMGHPAPVVQWLRNGEPVDDYDEETNEIFSKDPTSLAELVSKLIITSSSTASGDVFTCLATAGLKQISSSTTVLKVEDDDSLEDSLILQKLFKVPSKPVITSYYKAIFQNMGSDLLLPCRVDEGNDVFWQDSQNNPVYENARMRVLPSGDLLIASLSWADMGNFTCTTKNLYGKDSVSTFVYPLRINW